MNKTSSLARRLVLSIALLFSAGYYLNGQNVSVSGALSGNGSYPDLNSAFAAINAASQTAASISVNISANTTETVTAVLNAGAWSGLTVTPSGSVSVSGSLAAPLVDLNGADNVLINGLATGTNFLTFNNSDAGNAATSTIRLYDGASSNTIINCTIMGASSSTTLGSVYFAGSAAAGNSNNLLSACWIQGSGALTPVNGICAMGTASVANTSNTITNCFISDYFHPSLATAGIILSAGNTGWNVSGNYLFQQAARTYTTATTHKGIMISAGDDYIVSGNTIGYSGIGTGQTQMSGAVAIRYIAIDVSTGTLSPSSVQGNTVTAISYTSSSTAATANGVVCGISVGSGNVNIGTVSGNLVGGVSGLSHIDLAVTGAQGMVVGINSASTGTISIQNNTIGGLTSTGNTAALSGAVSGIIISGVCTDLSINSNIIGNASADNLRAGTAAFTTGSSLGSGIRITSSLPNTVDISGNIIRNIASYGTGTSGYVRGIWTGTGGAAIFSVTNNTVSNLVSDNANATIANGNIGTAGILLATGTTNTISGNTIHNISNINTATTAIISTGIALGGVTGITINNNRIYDIIKLAGTTGSVSLGVASGIAIRSGTNDHLIYNNMISLGNGQSANTSFIGIYLNHGSTPNPIDKIYYNSINIEGVAASGGAQPSFGILRGDLSTTARTATVDIRYNIITNTRSGGLGSHYAIANNYNATASATGWGANASDYNVLNANASTIGWWTGAQTFSGWKTASAGDVNSFSGITVTYVNSASDLHLNLGTAPTVIESGGQLISGISTDYDNQVRPGPAGSVNGGAIAPDLGADEFDGVILDLNAPVITHAPLTPTCGLGDRTFTASITDVIGLPTTGILQPRVYFTKNAGAYVSTQGALLSGSATNGIWSFTISGSAMGGVTGGDVISYFIIAQDNASTPNLVSEPSAGLVATDVNSVTTAPTTPFSYILSGVLNGTYTVGSGGNYTTLSAAANDYNISCLTGPVTFMLTDAMYSSAETFPIVFSNNPNASASFSLLVIPGPSVAATISGSAPEAVIKFQNARHISFDGINASSRSLSVVSTHSSTSSGFWLASTPSTGPGNNNIAIRRVTITGASNTNVNNYGIVACADGAAPSVAAGMDNDFITLEENTILRVFRGIYGTGAASVATDGIDNWTLTGNLIGPAGTGTDNIGGTGIYMRNAVDVTITGNTIRNLQTSATTTIGGINLTSFVSNVTVSQNTISNIVSSASSSGLNSINGILLGNSVLNATVSGNYISGIENTNVNGYGARGIIVNTANNASNVYIHNNMITDISCYADVSAIYWPIGIALEGTSGGVNVDFNTIHLFGSHTGISAASNSSPFYMNASGGNVTLRNNIFMNTYDNTSTALDEAFGIYSTAASTVFSAIDYNNYFAGGSGIPVLGYLGTNLANIAAIQTAFGGNVNSINAQPLFVSNNDLHLQTVVGNAPMHDAGTPVTGITQDIDLQLRSATVPDIGADEFTIPTCTVANGGVLSSASASACAGETLAVTSNGATDGLTTTYQWQYSTTQGGPYANVSGGSGATTTSYTSAALPTGTYYIVLQTTCNSASLTGYSNEGTLTVNAVPTATAGVVTPTLCSGLTLSLTGASDIGTSFLWTGPANFSSTAQNPAIAGIPNAGSGSYNLLASAAGCTSTLSSVSVTVVATPGALTVSPTSTLICSGNSATLSVAGGSIPAVMNFTPQTNQNSSTTYPAPYSVYYGGQKMQMLILASELSAAGLSAGPLTGIQFPVISFGANWGNSLNDLQNFEISIGATALNSVGASFQTGLSVVSTAANFTPVVGYNNIHTFNTPFVWDGTSNIIVQTVFSNNMAGASGDAVIQYNSPTSFQSTMVYRADNATFATIAAATTTNVATTLKRPDFKLHGQGTAPYTWTPATGLSSTTAATVTASPVVTTIYTVTAQNDACTSVTSTTVDVTPVPVLTVTSTHSAVCLGNSATLTASGAATYTWNTQASTSSIVVTPAVNTVYTVSTEAFPCPVTSETIAVIANPLPVLSVAATPSVVCAGQTSTLSVSGAATYSWSTGSLAATSTVAPLASTVYSVSGIDAQGCGSSTTIAVTSNSLPVLSIAQSAAAICAGSAVSFTASGAGTYSWSAGGANASVTYTPAVNTVYTVTGSLPTGCASSATATVTVNALPAIAISPSSVTICAGASATLSASGGASYVWIPGNMNTSTIVVSPSVTAVYSVTGTDANSCSNSTNITVAVLQRPNVFIGFSSNVVCVDEPVSLNASGATSYSWMPGNFNTPSITVNPASTTIFTLIAGPADCSTTKTVEITVDPCTGISGISPAGQSVSLYPNPTSGVITAAFAFEGSKDIVVTNATGALVLSESTTAAQHTLDLSGYARGIYFVRISGQNASTTYRVILQ